MSTSHHCASGAIIACVKRWRHTTRFHDERETNGNRRSFSPSCTYVTKIAYGLMFWKMGRYCRTYPECVADEVRAARESPTGQSARDAISLLARDTESNGWPAFLVPDENYLAARWPGDAWTFGREFAAMVGVSVVASSLSVA